MRTHVVVVTTEDLERFLEQEGRAVDTKDYEFHAALVLARFVAKQTGGTQRIAFPVRRERARELAPEETFEYLHRVLRECLDEDHPFDVVIVPESTLTSDEKAKRPSGTPFQLKRFVAKPESEDITDPLITYLNEAVPKKYAPVKDATLVILPERRGHANFTLDLEKARDQFRPDKFPFVQVMFIIPVETKIIIGALWPHFGRTEYSYSNWFDESTP